MQFFRVNTSGVWQTVELTDEEVEAVNKKALDTNKAILLQCINAVSKQSGILTINDFPVRSDYIDIALGIALFKMQANPAHFHLEEYAKNKAEALLEEEAYGSSVKCACGAIMGEWVAEDSKKKYGKPLCPWCQEKEDKIKNKA